MATLVADPGTQLVHATTQRTVVHEIVDLLVDAREAIIAAQLLLSRLRDGRALNDRFGLGVEPGIVENFIGAVTCVDPYAIDREHLYALLQVLAEEQHVLQQDVDDAMNTIGGGGPDAG